MKAVFFLLFFLISSFAAASVEDACKKAAASDPELNYGFCVASLKADPNSETADSKGLALIAAKLSVAKVSSIKSKIAKLPPQFSKALKDCSEVYSNALYDVNTAINNIKAGDLHSANTFISSAMSAPDDCETAFKELKLNSPLKEDDADASQLLTILLALTVSI